MLYRGSDCTEYAPFDEINRKFLVDDLRIRTELDLRYPQHVVGQSASILGHSVGWIHRPINAYHSFTPEQNEIFRSTLQLFARPELYPLYFHCSGGCDRTGEIAFLLNALLGVEAEELFLDYELSSLCFFPRPRTIPYFQEWLATLAGFAPQGSPFYIQAEQYMLAIGVAQKEIDSIRKILIQP